MPALNFARRRYAASRKVREAIAADVEASAQKLPRLKHTSNATGFRQRAQAVGALADVASTVFSWGADDRQPAVRIGVLAMASVKGSEPPGTTIKPGVFLASPVIDVEASGPQGAG
jgi:hypothetical protein